MEGKINETPELLAKMAEIASLKRAIESAKAAMKKNTDVNLTTPNTSVVDSVTDTTETVQQTKPILRGGPGTYRARGRGRGRGGYFGGFNRGNYGRGGAVYGGAVTKPFLHRNMSLVLNGLKTDGANSDGTSGEIQGGETTSSSDSSSTISSALSVEETYVSTVSRGGMKLVNTKIFQEDQNKIIENSERLKARKDKIKQANRLASLEVRISKNNVEYDNCDRTLLDGDLYAIARNGSRLVPLTLLVGNKRKIVIWNGKSYSRNSSGTLRRKVPKAFRYIEYCRYFTRTGICTKGSTCKYTHSANHLALCRLYPNSKCHNPNCPLSHESNDFNTPHCRYFLSGGCTNASCIFLHIKTRADAPICRPFSIGGWCDRGRRCPYKHLYECPDFEQGLECPRGRACKLSHTITKTQLHSSHQEDEDTKPPELLYFIDEEGEKEVPNEHLIDLNGYSSDEEENEESSGASESEEEETDALQGNSDYIEF